MRQGKQKSKSYAPKCQDPACTGKVACFGYEEDGKRVMCATHKAEGMTNLVSPVCEHPACTTIASFGFTKVSRSMCNHLTNYCTRIVTVELHCHSAIIFFTLLTLFFACTSIHQEKRFCVKHQMRGMISTSRKIYAHDGCSTVAYFGLEDDKASIFQNFACSCLTLCWPPTMCATIR
jgi:EsV-1-7 cysteine-rich motif